MNSPSNPVYIGIGSNLEDREQLIAQSIRSLVSPEAGCRVSSLYASSAWQMDEGSPDFLNLVLSMETADTPLEFLQRLEQIERSLGRTNKGTWQSRLIDLDLLLYGQTHLQTDRLTLPHPGMTQRSFVLLPLEELAPNLIDPVSRRPFSSYITPQMRREATRIGRLEERYVIS